MDLSVTTDNLVTADQSWLGSAHGTENCRPITLDVSAFTSGTHYPDGFFKSGIPLGKITSSGLYGPYAGRTNEVQTLTRTSTGGTVDLTFDGETVTGVVASAAGFTAAALQTKLESLPNVNPGDVTVAGSAGGPLTVTFSGVRFEGTNVPAITVDNTNATGGTITNATSTAGGAGASDGTEVFAGLLFNAPKAPAANTTDIQGALFEHGRVISANLPIAVDAAGRDDAKGRIVFV